jgi:hypothetical protein
MEIGFIQAQFNLAWQVISRGVIKEDMMGTLKIYIRFSSGAWGIHYFRQF